MMMDAPLLLGLAPLLALLLGLLAWRARRARVRRATAWSSAVGERARQANRHGWLVFGVTGVLLGVGLAGPRGGRLEVDATSRALNLVIGVDLSRSMLAEDVAPNRLGRAVREARRLSQDLAQDRIGLLGFAGSSYILAPLTLDHAAVELHLTALDPDLASEGGTNLARVLQQGGEVLDGAGQGGDRALVLFTDGETHDSLSESIAAAAALREAGVTLVLVSVGDTIPTRIPLRDPNGRRTGYQVTAEGTPVETMRRDDLLQPVAEAAGGVVVSATVQNQSGEVVGVLRELARAPARERRAQDRRPLAWVMALVAALLLLGHTLARRGAALVSIALVALSVPRLAEAQRPSGGITPARRGDHARAEAAFRAEAARTSGAARDTALFNAGTAALAAGRYAEAHGALDSAANTLDPELRYRALYNHGVASLRAAALDSVHRDSLLALAADRLKEALLLRPDADRAKWNLELAMRRPPPPPPSPQGGGGGNPPPPPPGNGEGPQRSPEPRPGAMTRAEAEAILSSVERGEAATRAEQARRRRATARVVKDW